jgi:putative OPT family oligopeptide transporter
VQTGASAAASIAAGVIFTIPALVINGYWPDFKYWWVLTIAGLGGILGVLFSVPLRRSLIIEQGLAFPEGKAAAEVLRAGDNPTQGLNVLATAGLLGGLGKFAAASGLNLIPDTAFVSGWLGRTIAYFGTNLSPALLGVGYIVGLNIGVVVIAAASFPGVSPFRSTAPGSSTATPPSLQKSPVPARQMLRARSGRRRFAISESVPC